MRSRTCILLSAALLAGCIALFLTVWVLSPRAPRLSYGALIKQIKAGNVELVEFRQHQAVVTFKKPIGPTGSLGMQISLTGDEESYLIHVLQDHGIRHSANQPWWNFW